MGDSAPDRLREILRLRHFVDRESGALVIWLPSDAAVRRQLADLVPQVEARHLASRIAVHQSGAALALRITGRDSELELIEAEYLS